MHSVILRADARTLPLPAESVDLIVTSPPYFGLRSYTDAGKHYGGQIGSEATPAAWLAAMVECTREWVRVLKPSGSIFVNLGDKFSDRGHGPSRGNGTSRGPQNTLLRQTRGPMEKSLLGLPWRYALACVDDLGLILRRDIIWSKPNGLPESVTDRCRSSHEYVFHLVRQPRYYAAVDEIREPHAGTTHPQNPRPKLQSGNGITHRIGGTDSATLNPLGKLPGSVWDIPSQPLTVPPELGVDHFAAFPMELPRRCVLGWSPPGVCTRCGEGRRPVVDRHDERPANGWPPGMGKSTRLLNGVPGSSRPSFTGAIVGYACACILDSGPGDSNPSDPVQSGKPRVGASPGPVLSPTRPAVVLDPFGGTGTTALVAAMHGRLGISVDRSADYCRLAAWRTTDPAQRAAALQVPKPPPVPDGMTPLF